MRTQVAQAGLLLAILQGLGTVPEAVAAPSPGPVASPSRPLDRSIPVTLGAPETASNVSIRYYGSPVEARALLLANGLPAWGRRLPRLPSEKPLRLPTSWSYRIRSGDTWAQLAADYLGDGTLGPFLARLNHKPEVEAAPPGHVIVIPTVLEAEIPRGMRLEKLAGLLLDLPARDGRVAAQAQWIRDFNGLKPGAPPPRPGLRIPLPGLRLLGWYVPTALPRQDPGTRRRAERAIREARAESRKGRFVEALERLGPLASGEGLPRVLRAEIHLVRCTAFVALDRALLAVEAARAALAARPGWVLDPVQVSPKVRAVFDRAGQTSRPPPRRSPAPGGGR